ncbi:leukotriene B4 receptor 2a isoform X2 [Betta splendens]|uniref:Leukotriene B4 receptor 2a isoform X2 n=1 Tax=Betta splendens TaxID=158456 RepID=A0A9W2XDC4_BETSP|nr:leukotriene B4 receptor 2a isoform X2 [Betta splendens]
MHPHNSTNLLNRTSPPNDSIVNNPITTSIGALILSLVFILGCPGNAFVIWSIVARARQHSVTTLLILNLAIADGSLMALTPFFIIYMLIMLMSLYRLVAVLWPQRVGAITSQRKVMRALAVMWALVMLASIPALIFRSVENGVCDSHHKKDSDVVLQYTLELVLGFLIPYAVILVSYICILRRIRQTKFRRRIRSEKLILAIVLTFCLFWLPYHMVNIVQVIWASSPKGELKTLLGRIWNRSRAVVACIAFISSCVNPVLYFFAGKSYIRREGLAFMARLFDIAGVDSRKSRQNSQNSRDKDKDADAVTLKDKDQDSLTNSSFNVKPMKNGN